LEAIKQSGFSASGSLFEAVEKLDLEFGEKMLGQRIRQYIRRSRTNLGILSQSTDSLVEPFSF